MDTSAQYGQMDFNLPHDVVELPSKGIFYKTKKLLLSDTRKFVKKTGIKVTNVVGHKAKGGYIIKGYRTADNKVHKFF